MIRSNAASAEAYWELLPALLSERRRAAGREPHSGRRLAAQPGYLGEWLLRRRHRWAPISVIRCMDIRVTLIPVTVIQPMDIRGTHRRAMDIQAIRAVLVSPAPLPMDTKPMRSIPLRPAMSTGASQGTPLSPVRKVTDIEAVPLNRGSAWAFLCLAPLTAGPVTEEVARTAHGPTLLVRKHSVRKGSWATHPRQPVS